VSRESGVRGVRGEGASSVADILTEPVSAPNVWTGDELADAGGWIIHFAEEDLADFERALAHVARRHVTDVTEIRAEDFPLPHFRERIDDITGRLENGPGLVLLRGLPVYDRFSADEAAVIYWGMGRHMGNLVPQNRKGDLIGQIRDLGRRGPYERAYATNEDLGFHTDSTDFVGLMCLRPALHGGESFVASSGLLYNFVVREHPEYLPILNKNFPTDWRSEEPPGSPGWYLEPLYSYFGGALSATVRTGRAMSAMRFPDVPRLTADEVSCFMYFDSLPKRPGVALGMQLQPGDLQFLNNFVTVHNRSAFVDDAEDPARQRHLLRLWISRPGAGRPLCPEYAAWRGGYPT
jgi:Taurine catabolism dioxygenase TauD, TfdA family